MPPKKKAPSKKAAKSSNQSQPLGERYTDNEATDSLVQVSLAVSTPSRSLKVQIQSPVETPHATDTLEDEDSEEGCGYSLKEVDQLIENFDLEATTRLEAIDSKLQDLLENHLHQCEDERLRLSKHVRDISVADFFVKYNGSLKEALRAMASKRTAEIDIEELEKTAKKRMRTIDLSHVEGAEKHLKSIGKQGKTTSMASLSRGPLAADMSPTAVKSTRARARISSSASTSIAGGAPNNGFVYRARLSSSHSSLNPRLPPTPSIASVRKPRRNESIQAYSMNGSPLGIIDVEDETEEFGLESAPASPKSKLQRSSAQPAPTSAFTFEVAVPEQMKAVLEGLNAQLASMEMSEDDRKALQGRLFEMMAERRGQGDLG